MRLGPRVINQMRREQIRIIDEEPPYYIQKLSIVSLYLVLLANLKMFFVNVDLS